MKEGKERKKIGIQADYRLSELKVETSTLFSGRVMAPVPIPLDTKKLKRAKKDGKRNKK